MNLNERKQAFIALGKVLQSYINNTEDIGDNKLFEQLDKAIEQAYIENHWFTKKNVHQAIKAIANTMLDEGKLTLWLNRYPQIADNSDSNQKTGIIMAGNISLVGFHDLFCVLLCGYCAVIKPSSKDSVLIHAITDLLCEIEPRFKDYIFYTQQHPINIDLVISTGSNNSARYFESWYDGIPHIIRKNRNSIAILTGEETTHELQELGKDIFSYFGLGCRNVSALFVPQNYDFNKLIDSLSIYSNIFEHKEYNDCYRYQKALLEMDNISYYDTGFLLLKNSTSLSAPIALVNYQKYTNLGFAKEIIKLQQNSIQCVVYQHNDIENAVKFGQTQSPELYDYADGIDTMNFLLTNF